LTLGTECSPSIVTSGLPISVLSNISFADLLFALQNVRRRRIIAFMLFLTIRYADTTSAHPSILNFLRLTRPVS